MSNEDKPGDDLDAAWGSSQDGGFGVPDDGGHYSGAINQSAVPEQPQVVDVEELPSSKKSGSKVGLLIAVFGGAAAVGLAGFIGLSLYSKLSPPKSQSQASTPFDRQGDVGGVPAAQAQDPGSAAILPGGADASATTPVAGQNAMPDASQGAAVPASPVDPASSPQQGSARQDASAAQVASGPATAPSAAQGQVTQPQVPQPGIAKPVEPAAPVICPVADSKPVVAEKRKPEKKAQKTQAPKAVSTASVREQKKQRSERKSAADKQNKSAESAVAAGAATDAAVTQKPSGGTLDGYRLMSIWPKAGEHQQATVKDANGANHVLRAGDVIAGSRVRAVNALKYEVETDAGFIR
jgi:hypothetical protein